MNAIIDSLRPIDSLAKYGIVYLATPYSKYYLGRECAFVDAARVAGQLLLRGVKVYSPIAHTHPIAEYTPIDPLDHTIWLPFDEAMMEAAGAIVVAKLEGWRDSYGIQHEIKFFTAANKPVYVLDPKTMELESYQPVAEAA